MHSSSECRLPCTYLAALKIHWSESWPLLIAQVVNQASNAFFSFCFANAGGESLAAYGPAATVYGIVNILNFPAAPLNMNVRDELKSNPSKVGVHFRLALLMSLGLSICFSPPIAYAGNIYDAMGNHPGVGRAINDFLQGIVLTGGIFPIMAQNVIRRLLIGLKKTKVSMGMTLGYSALSVAMTACFTYKISHSPRGLGYASSMSAWLTFLVMMLHLGLSQSYASYSLFKSTDCSAPILTNAKKGLFMISGPAIEYLLLIVFAGLLGRYNKTGLEAFNVASSYAKMLIVASFSAIGAPLSALLTSYKDQDTGILKNCYHAGLTLAALCALPIFFGSLFFPIGMIKLFASKIDQPDLFINILRGVSAGGLMDCVRLISSAAIRPFHRDSVSLLINTASLGLGFIFALVCHWAHQGPLAMVLCLYGGFALAGALQTLDACRTLSNPPQANRESLPLLTAITQSSDLRPGAKRCCFF